MAVVKYVTTAPLYCSLCILMGRKDWCRRADRTFLVWEGAFLITIRHKKKSGMSVWPFLPQIFFGLGTFGAQDAEWGRAALGKSAEGEILVPEGASLIIRGWKLEAASSEWGGHFLTFCHFLTPKSKMLVWRIHRGIWDNVWEFCASRAYRPLNHIHLQAGGQVKKNGFTIFWFLV